MPILVINDVTSFNNLVSNSGNKLIVIDFSAKWCGPCKRIAPQFNTLASTMNDVVFCKVDIDSAKDLASNFKIKTVPTFVFIKNGATIQNATVQGANISQLFNNCKKLK